jgi:hypothetical protein
MSDVRLFPILVALAVPVLLVAVTENVLVVGATRKGKTLSAARALIESPRWAWVALDPHKKSLAETLLIHATGNVLFDRLSNVERYLCYDMLSPSTNRDLRLRYAENLRKTLAFVAILLRRRGTDSLAGNPLTEEWCVAAIMLWLSQDIDKPLTYLPFAFLPGTDQFRALVRGCTDSELALKFGQLVAMTPRGLRSEVGSAARLINAVFRSPSFQVRCGKGFDLGGFLQTKGKLIVERGDDIDDDAMRVIMGAIVLLVIEHANRRPTPYPPIRIVIDEANNAGLIGGPELKGIAETNKLGLYWTFLVQNLNFPGDNGEILQNCTRHEWFGCPNYDLARKAATDFLAGLQ